MAIVSVLKAEEDVEDPLRMAEEERGGRIKAGLGVLTVRILRSESSLVAAFFGALVDV